MWGGGDDGYQPTHAAQPQAECDQSAIVSVAMLVLHGGVDVWWSFDCIWLCE